MPYRVVEIIVGLYAESDTGDRADTGNGRIYWEHKMGPTIGRARGNGLEGWKCPFFIEIELQLPEISRQAKC